MEQKLHETLIDTPLWGKKVKVALINKDLSVTKLSEEIEVNRVTVSSVISGRLINPAVQSKICNFLGITI